LADRARDQRMANTTGFASRTGNATAPIGPTPVIFRQNPFEFPRRSVAPPAAAFTVHEPARSGAPASQGRPGRNGRCDDPRRCRRGRAQTAERDRGAAGVEQRVTTGDDEGKSRSQTSGDSGSKGRTLMTGHPTSVFSLAHYLRGCKHQRGLQPSSERLDRPSRRATSSRALAAPPTAAADKLRESASICGIGR